MNAANPCGWLVFGRDAASDAIYGPWWPLFTEDGPHVAESAGAAIALIRERLALGNEADTWLALAATPATEWTVDRADA